MRPSAESLLVICNFCGEIVAESHISPHAIVKPLPMTPPEGPGQVRSMELILVPFFEVKADVSVDALGYQRRERTETKTVRRGGKTYTESKTIVEYRPWRVQHKGSHNVRFLARQEVTMFGSGELVSSVARTIGGEPIPFSPEFIKGLASRDQTLVALSPEWGQDEASKKAGEVIYESAYSHAKSQMHKVFDTKVNFKPLTQPKLVHEPLLLIRRRIQGRLYRAAYHWGSGQLLREEQPIKNRGLMMFFALLGFLLAPILTQIGYNQYIAFEPSSENAIWWLIALGVVALAGVIVGIILLVRVYKPHKIHSSGSGLSLFAFERLAPTARAAIPKHQPQQPASGKPVARFCPKCGDPLEQNQKFCEKCGQVMDGR